MEQPLCECACTPKGPQVTRAPKQRCPPRAVPGNSGLCGCSHQVAGSITESHVLRHSSWGETCSGSFPRGSAPVPPASHHSLEPDLGTSTTTTGEQTLPPCRAVTSTKQRGGPTQHPLQALVTTATNTPPIKGTRATLRKEMASIHTKNSPHTRNFGFKQATQGHSHIKTALQDHSR